MDFLSKLNDPNRVPSYMMSFPHRTFDLFAFQFRFHRLWLNKIFELISKWINKKTRTALRFFSFCLTEKQNKRNDGQNKIKFYCLQRKEIHKMFEKQKEENKTK